MQVVLLMSFAALSSCLCHGVTVTAPHLSWNTSNFSGSHFVPGVVMLLACRAAVAGPKTTVTAEVARHVDCGLLKAHCIAESFRRPSLAF